MKEYRPGQNILFLDTQDLSNFETRLYHGSFQKMKYAGSFFAPLKKKDIEKINAVKKETDKIPVVALRTSCILGPDEKKLSEIHKFFALAKDNGFIGVSDLDDQRTEEFGEEVFIVKSTEEYRYDEKTPYTDDESKNRRLTENHHLKACGKNSPYGYIYCSFENTGFSGECPAVSAVVRKLIDFEKLVASPRKYAKKTNVKILKHLSHRDESSNTHYLYESHMGGFFYTNIELDYDDLYCEDCGDNDQYIGCFGSFEDAWNYLKEDTGKEYPEYRYGFYHDYTIEYVFEKLMEEYFPCTALLTVNGENCLTIKEILNFVGRLCRRAGSSEK